jgi:hypothetical protein
MSRSSSHWHTKRSSARARLVERDPGKRKAALKIERQLWGSPATEFVSCPRCWADLSDYAHLEWCPSCRGDLRR